MRLAAEVHVEEEVAVVGDGGAVAVFADEQIEHDLLLIDLNMIQK